MFRFCLMLALAWLVAVGPARAVFPPEIKDGAKFFKTETVEKANKKIKELYQKYKKDVVIETLASVPTELEKKFKDDGREKFFTTYALDRIKALGVNGIYILLVKKPGRLQIEMDSDTRKTAFKNTDRNKVREAMIKGLKDEKYDDALTNGLEGIETALKAGEKKK